MVLGGCAPQAVPATPTGEVLLESLVAEAVDTQRADLVQDEQRVATLTVAAGEPAVLQAQTLTPTITHTPEFSATPVNPLPSLAPGDTATPIPPAVPTRQPGDPALRLGDPDWTDTFDNGSNWGEYADSRAQIEVRDGKLFFTAFEAGSGPIWTLSWPDARNFYLEIIAHTASSCRGKDRYGLVVRAPDPSHGYRLEISCDGQYRMVEFDEDGSQVVVAWASSEHLLAGPNQINRIGVWTEGPVLAIHLNGARVAGVPHETYPRGRFGLTITAEETANFMVSFDDLALWTFE